MAEVYFDLHVTIYSKIKNYRYDCGRYGHRSTGRSAAGPIRPRVP